MKKGIFFVIIGPSGVGKGTILSEFKIKNNNKNIYFPVTSTTRNPRSKEKHGKDYYFLSKEEFIEGINNGDFLEYAVVHKVNYYGLPKKQVIDNLNKGIHVIRELDIQGLFNLKKLLPKEQIYSIFFTPPSLKILENRIRKRGALPEEEIYRRLETAKNEISKANECDKILVSEEGKIVEVLDEFTKIINNAIN